MVETDNEGSGSGDSRLEQRIVDIVVERTHTPREQVTRDARLYDLTDSLGLTEVVMDLEDEFEGSMPDEDVGTIQTVGQLFDYVKTHFDTSKSRDKTGP